MATYRPKSVQEQLFFFLANQEQIYNIVFLKKNKGSLICLPQYFCAVLTLFQKLRKQKQHVTQTIKKVDTSNLYPHPHHRQHISYSVSLCLTPNIITNLRYVVDQTHDHVVFMPIIVYPVTTAETYCCNPTRLTGTISLITHTYCMNQVAVLLLLPYSQLWFIYL